MKKLSAKGLKALKIVHLVCATLWFGSAIVMNLLRILVNTPDNPSLYYMAEVLEAVDMKILVPGAIGCLLTGIIYGCFTNWGFFRYRWLTVKWILTVFMISLGTFYLGPLVRDNVVIGKALMDGSCTDASLYWQNVNASSHCGLLQIILLVVVFVVSVFKPWKKKAKR